MSCHDIGAGLNTVSVKVLQLYDEGKLETDIVKDLLRTIKKGVHWCDGNEYEAVECFKGCRCGRCLKKADELHELDETSVGYNEFFDIIDDKENGIITDGFCKDCFDEICRKYNLTMKD